MGDTSPLRTLLHHLLPKLCGLVAELDLMISEYVQGTKYPQFPPLPNDFVPSGANLLMAGRGGDLQQLQYLLEVKCDPAEPNREIYYRQWTALHHCACAGQMLCLQYLLSKGHSAATQCSLGWTILYTAIFYRQFDIAHYLLDFHNLVPANHSSGARLLTDVRDKSGYSVLHIATSVACIPIIERLVLDCGLDPNDASNVQGIPPLFFDVETLQVPIFKCLVSLGADWRQLYRGSSLADAVAVEDNEPLSAYLESVELGVEEI